MDRFVGMCGASQATNADADQLRSFKLNPLTPSELVEYYACKLFFFFYMVRITLFTFQASGRGWDDGWNEWKRAYQVTVCVPCRRVARALVAGGTQLVCGYVRERVASVLLHVLSAHGEVR